MTEVDLSDRALRVDPYPTYARLRAHAPVTVGKASMLGKVWLVTRYDDVLNGLKHPALSSDLTKRRNGTGRLTRWTPRLLTTLQETMVTTDEPDHRRLRDLVHLAFSPRRVEQMTRRIEEITGTLLDRAARKGRIDLIAAVALPLPLTIISDMLGVPDSERLAFRAWSARFLEIAAGGSLLKMMAAIPNGIRLNRFLEKLIAERRTNPQDDLISALVQAEANGDCLSEREVLSMIFLLLLAGHETTVNLIGNGVLALLEHPDQMQKLREHPQMIETAVEELLRYSNPVEHGNLRLALDDVEIAGQRIPKGSIVILLLASANRDASVFDEPDRLEIERNPNRHLGFGFGAHYCLGAQLARIEGRIAIQQLVERFPGMRLAVPAAQLRWRDTVAVRGLETLPIDLNQPLTT
jgi:cytochrome P450 PksS